jgi:CHASE2 domain-containing sensor protein
MSKLVVLSLGNGDLESGFPAVTAQLWEAGMPSPMKFTGSLPAAPKLPQLYGRWQLLYENLYRLWGWHPRSKIDEEIEIDEEDVTNVSAVEFNDLCHKLQDNVNAWLNSELFRNIDQQLRTQLETSAEIQFIIETNDNQLRRLPWHLWNFFEHYPKAEVALSASEYQRPNKSVTKTPSAKVRILAIMGNGKGIDIRKDRAILAQLSDKAETKFLVEPQPEKLNDQLWEQGWDILFFAGHSYSKEKGILQLNQKDAITLDKLRNALKKAISRGLKLAIFNSCDGLGLAQQLADLHIPQVIVMREPVPDVVAQEFLRDFLWAFSGGQSLYASVREARERLQKLEGKYPCATWLPVICQNPAFVPTTWQEWCDRKKRDRQILPSRSRLQTVLVVSVVVTALVMGVRQLGMLQRWELQAFDQLMGLRPDEGPDPRLLVVTVTEKDVQNQNPQERRGSSLSDRALVKLLEKLQSYQPRVIGLDIYHDFPVDPNHAELETHLHQNQRLIAVCKVSDPNKPGISPPPGFPADQLGFTDVVTDNDGILRRHLFYLTPVAADPCQTPYSFNLQLALAYLAEQGILLDFTDQGYLHLGTTIFKPLEKSTGGYQQLDETGHQVLLNYRSSHSVAQQVTLTDILNDSINPNIVKDRIVLIGTTAESFKDYFSTPYSTGQWSQEMPGVVIHAHMVSQILSAVLDRRPLLWWWPSWGETLWIWGWSVVGGVMVWHLRSRSRVRLAQSPLYLGMASGAALVTLYGLCFVLLLKGGWVPLVPSALALAVTGGGVVAYTAFVDREKQYISIT